MNRRDVTVCAPRGEMLLQEKCAPIDKVLADPRIPPDILKKLQQDAEVRRRCMDSPNTVYELRRGEYVGTCRALTAAEKAAAERIADEIFPMSDDTMA